VEADEVVMSPNEHDYVRFDQREDVLASLELLHLIAPLLQERPSYWKWMIIGADNALYGAMVCALDDSTRTSTLTKKSRTKMLRWLRGETKGGPPKVWLEDYNVLLNKCVSDLRLVLTWQQRKDIERLHDEFRNELSHFKPGQGWSIEKAELLPRIIESALVSVTYLMNLNRRGVQLDAEERQRLKAATEGTRLALKTGS
jgi:hypothetical protein